MNEITYEQFKEAWLEDVKKDASSNVELGLRFAHKLVCDWLDVDPDSGDVIMTDGSGDGGIDAAILQRYAEIGETESEDVWYLVQSKYGSSFAGSSTVYDEGVKLIETLTNPNVKLNENAAQVVERIQFFLKKRGPKDKLCFVIATVDDIGDEEKEALENVKIIGKAKIGSFFEVAGVSINTVYNRLQELNVVAHKKTFVLDINAYGSDELIFGAVGLLELYRFLKHYKNVTNDLNLLYEKNVRQYLGLKKVAKGIRDTLLKEPERFGLYNNGITIVVEECEKVENGWKLTAPYIVNGCQTTRTIYDVLSTILESGGTSKNEDFSNWQERLQKGFVVIKIVKVGPGGEELLEKTTRFTNSQNAVSEKDFISLSNDFRRFKEEMQKKYGIFLEIQRGAKAAQEARQKSYPYIHPYYHEFANAFDLIKTYSAGWLSMPGPAFAHTPPFSPGGSVFKRLTEPGSDFGVDDLYAAYRIMKYAMENHFGRQKAGGRGSTRFLFVFVVIELFKEVMRRSGMKTENKAITQAMIKLLKDEELTHHFFRFCAELIDQYTTKSDSEMDNSLFSEPRYLEHGDLNSYLKSESLGRDRDYTPGLFNLIAAFKTQLSLTGLLNQMKMHLLS